MIIDKMIINNKNILVKSGEIKYIESVLDLLKSIRLSFKEKNIDIYQNEEYPNKEILSEDLERGKSTVLLVEEDSDKVIGFMTSYDNELDDLFYNNPAELNYFLEKFKLDNKKYPAYARLMIDPNYRKNGLGTYLFKFMEKMYEGNTVMFCVHPDNLNAIQLYIKLGYSNLGDYDFTFGKYYIFVKNL